MAERLFLGALVPAVAGVVLYLSREPRMPGASGSEDLAPRFVPEPREIVDAVAGTGRPRVLFIGVDGASWDRIERGVKEGRLPTFARLVAGGRRSDLETLVPTRSPAIWTTMMTGARPEEHGITDFHLLLMPRIEVADLRMRRGFSVFRDALAAAGELHRVLVTSSLRRRKALWNLADEAGLRSAVLGFWGTWPPEHLENGLIASDHASRPYPGGVTTHPPSLSDVLDRFRRAPETVTREELSYFATVDDRLWEEFRKMPHFVPRARLSAFRSTNLDDEFFASSAAWLWETEKPDLLIVYLRSVDEFSHLFYEMGVPEAAALGHSSEDIRHYAKVVDRMYEWTDRRLAALVDAVDRDRDTLLVLVSDHGWRKQPSGHYEHADGPPGVLVLYGSGVCRENCAPIRSASVYDLAPTILWRMRLPLSEELPGRRLAEAFEDSPPVVAVARYGARLGRDEAIPSEHDAAGYEKLKALGYTQ